MGSEVGLKRFPAPLGRSRRRPRSRAGCRGWVAPLFRTRARHRLRFGGNRRLVRATRLSDLRFRYLRIGSAESARGAGAAAAATRVHGSRRVSRTHTGSAIQDTHRSRLPAHDPTAPGARLCAYDPISFGSGCQDAAFHARVSRWPSVRQFGGDTDGGAADRRGLHAELRPRSVRSDLHGSPCRRPVARRPARVGLLASGRLRLSFSRRPQPSQKSMQVWATVQPGSQAHRTDSRKPRSRD